MLAILILAAGQSSRMRGRDKLLEEIDGEVMLTRATRVALDTGSPVYVTLPPHAETRSAVLPVDVQIVTVEAALDGMGASIAAGIGALSDEISAAMIQPADMPNVTHADLLKMIEAHEDAPTAILRATSQGQPGHPVVFPAAYFEDLMGLTGDQGARAIIRENAQNVQHVPLPGKNALTDLDTPEAWTAWRQSHGKE